MHLTKLHSYKRTLLETLIHNIYIIDHLGEEVTSQMDGMHIKSYILHILIEKYCTFVKKNK